MDGEGQRRAIPAVTHFFELVPTNALVTDPINSETVVSKVKWAAAGKNAPQPSDAPETLVLYRTRVFCERVAVGAVVFARSIKPFEGGRWWLRRMRDIGYGN